MNLAASPANDAPCSHCGMTVSKGFCYNVECIRKSAGTETFEQAFDAKLIEWLANVNEMIESRRLRSTPPEVLAKYPEINKRQVVQERGPKYVRIVSRDVRDGKLAESGSAYAFIERATGHILKPDGWKRPAKGIRGNIFAPEPVTSAVNEHGANYFRR